MRKIAIAIVIILFLVFYISLFWLMPWITFSKVGIAHWGCEFWLSQLITHSVIALTVFSVWAIGVILDDC